MPPTTLLGLDLGAGQTKAVVCDPSGRILAQAIWPSIPADPDPLAHLLAQLELFLPEPPAAIGIAICGLIAPDGSTMLHAPNALPLQGLPYREALIARFGVPVGMLNDAKAFIYAEHQRGAATDARHALGLTLGTGIGGGLILDGALYLGAHGWLGEIGHIPLDPEGPLCLCGLYGCLEVYNGEVRVVQAFNAQITDPRTAITSGRELIDRAALGDPDALIIWERYGTRLGEAIANAVTLLDLELVVLGGGMANGFDFFIEALQETLHTRLSRADERGVRIRRASLGPLAGAIGAALWAREHGSRSAESATAPSFLPLPDEWQELDEPDRL